MNCSDCQRPLPHNPRRKGTRCRRCFARHIARSEAKREACRRAMKERFEDPGYCALHLARTKDGLRKSMKDPEFVAMRREQGRRCGLLRSGQNRYGPGTPQRLAAGRSRRETVLGWCPVEYRAEYQRLIRSKQIRAPEARRMIEAMIVADLNRFLKTGRLQQSSRLEGSAA